MRRVALLSLLACSSAAAQDLTGEGDAVGPSARLVEVPYAARLEQLHYAGSCGVVAVTRAGDEYRVDPLRTQELIGTDRTHPGDLGYYARGLGSPGHGAELALDMYASSIGERYHMNVAVDYRLALYTIPELTLRRSCLTFGVHGHAVSLWAANGNSSAEANGANHAFRIGLLVRTGRDSIRFHFEIEGALPSFDQRVDPRRLEVGLNGALTRSVDDELYYLYPLEWGGRALATLGLRLGDSNWDEYGVWIQARVGLGYARIATSSGGLEGLIGGVRLDVLAGGRWQGTDFSLRMGARAAIGLGSLWPTDVLLPLEALGVIEVGFAQHVVIDLSLGPVFFRFISALGLEKYLHGGLTITFYFERGVARPLSDPSI